MKHYLGIAESGGSTKGAYQAGVKLALEQRGILQKATYYAGTSVGAINAAAMTTLTPKQLSEVYMSLEKRSDVFKFAAWRLEGLYSLEPIITKMSGLIDPSNPRGIEAVACAINQEYTSFRKIYASNKEMSFDAWYKYVQASATIPGLMEPTFGEWFDGGIREYIPVEETISRCENVIAIATSPIYPKPKKTSLFWPRILARLWIAVDGAMQQEIKVNDFRVICEENHVNIICPKESLGVGTFEVKHETLKRIHSQGFEDGMKAEVHLTDKG